MTLIATLDELSSLKILTYPNPALTKKSEPVEEVNDDIRALAQAIAETMVNAPGIGLAAPQVGILKRIIVIDTARVNIDIEGASKPLTMINPTIIETCGLVVDEEGCLSMPKLYADVPRPEKIRAEYTDIDGKRQEISATGYLARCIAHEIDHLDGVLFWDHLGVIRRNMLKLKFTNLKAS
ncbi:Peptide deformylase [hydrothermal vent metagenome]|uniref:Peptide deformylase n=1 Tax=hydrothermal vent metagenome TaxID=652676 RepID=A0A3B1BYY9_9ZZZZ